MSLVLSFTIPSLSHCFLCWMLSGARPNCLQDAEVGRAFQKFLEKQGLKFMFGTKVVGSNKREDGVTVTLGELPLRFDFIS